MLNNMRLQNTKIQSKIPPSKIGLVSNICCSIQECFPLIAARYCNSSLVFSVFPAPDSPLTTMHWFCLEKIVANVKVRLGIQLQGSFHHCVAVVSNSKHVGRMLANLLVSIQLDLVICVNWKDLVRINSHKDGSSVGLKGQN